MKGILVEIDDDLHKKFRVKLFKEGLTIKSVLTEFIEEYAKEDGDEPGDTTSTKNQKD